jgi:diguanylate cyclase (GGDEF)-like protein
MLEALADQVAGAIHLAGNARRLAELNRLMEQRSAELQTTNLQLRVANAALERLAQRDGLTGVANRRHFDSRILEHWRVCADMGVPLALLLFDIDHFKPYNDGYGHLPGDDCLRRVAGVAADYINEIGGGDMARYGGEEFVVVLPGMDAAAALAVGETLCQRVRALALPHAYCARGTISVSVGAGVVRPGGKPDPEDLIRRADAALYRAKAEGRDRVAFAE